MHDKTSTAWMVRRDGKAIPCVQHIYADSSELDETLYVYMLRDQKSIPFYIGKGEEKRVWSVFRICRYA